MGLNMILCIFICLIWLLSYSYFYDSISLLLKEFIGFSNLGQWETVRDKRCGVNFFSFVAITFICLNVLYNSCRYTTHNSSCFYILCYNCSCCYNCSFTDGDTRTDGYVCTKPHLIFNANWLECHVATMLWIGIVIDSTECCVMTNKAIIAVF